jgi:hypothetical protein
MSDTAMLALAVVLIYLSECVTLLPAGAAAFRRAWLREWAVVAPWELFGGLRSSLLPGNPLPPLGTAVACIPADGRPASLDHRAFRLKVDAFTSAARPLLVACNVLWAWLFLGLPAAAILTSLVVTWPYLAGGTFLLTAVCAILFGRAWRELDPLLGGAPLQHTATIALVPTTAIRAADLLARGLGEGVHPLAAALALLPRDGFTGYARRFHFDAIHRDPASTALPSPWFDESQRDAIERFLSSNGAAPEQLLLAPVPTDEHSRTFCPRCHTQFTVTEGTCKDCGGITLARF